MLSRNLHATFLRFAACLFVISLIGVISAGCARYRPDFSKNAPYFQRVQTQEKDNVSVSVVGLSAEESKKTFGAKLAKKKILPLWLKIENRDPKKSYFFWERGIDADYYPAGEAAYMLKVKPGIRLFDRPLMRLLLPLGFLAMPIDHFFVQPANDKMRETFTRESIRFGWIAPGETKSGFIFVPLELGTKQVTVDLYGDEIKTGGEGLKHFNFFVQIPGIQADYRTKKFESYYRADQIKEIADDKEFAKEVVALPCCVTNASGTKNGDPVNLVVIGTQDELLSAFTTAKWDETEILSFKTAMKMAGSFLFGESYDYSPFSSLYLYGRSQDIGLQKARNMNERLHLRLWYSPIRYKGKPVWVGQVSRDIGVRFTTKTWNLMTHKIDPDIDESAVYVLSDLMYHHRIAKQGPVGGSVPSTPEKPAKNLTGDPYFTSGKRVVILLSENIAAGPPGWFDWQ
ncbi:MAG TPA: LssY C-terminal domain-containing protein [Candidatus Omnitrophota bacterium]|nr:LssY C-terminal domain-containing protein [Candidatus Omnitrophota bacterium]